jgi:restriction system protein
MSDTGSGERAVWGIHMEWDVGATPREATEIAIGWPALGDLSTLASSRDAFKAAYTKAYPTEKPGAVPVRAGMLFRFAKEIRVGDVMVYPSKFDKTVNIGLVASDYRFSSSKDPEYPHRRTVDWKAHSPRPQFSKPALDEIGSAITLFRISNNTEEFIAALEGAPFNAADVDAVTAVDTAVQAQESVEDFVIKRLKNGMSDEQFEHFVAELLRSMGYHARVTPHKGDGGIDILAHRDELGFEGIIKVQCKHSMVPIGGPQVQQLLGTIEPGEKALFVTLGDYTADAVRIQRGKSHLRLIGGAEFVGLIFAHYDKFEPRIKALLPLKRSYIPAAITNGGAAAD